LLNRVRRPAFFLGGIVLVLAIVGVVALSSRGGKEESQPPPFAEADFPTATPEPTPEPEPPPPPPPPVYQDPNLAEIPADSRLVISKIGVNAPLTLKTVGLNGVMPDPDNPDDIAYYNFSAHPGFGGGPGRGGNSVFAGHVDSGFKPCKNGTVKAPCVAVLYSLKTLKSGDEIELRVGGQSYMYQVTSNEAIDAHSGAWDKIVASTAQESVTIITCGGTFKAGEYNNRQVVTAVRV
jgi:LPXTG-site transpeptidase (sortase) family protein